MTAGRGQMTPPLTEKTALIVIDVQEGFEDPSWGERNNPQAEWNISELLSFWRKNERPVFHVRHLSLEKDSPLAPDGPGAKIKNIVRPEKGEPLVEKNVNSAFMGTNLEERLRGQK